MNKILRTRSSNKQIIRFTVIIGFFALFLSGCQPTAEQAKNATNTAPTNTMANSAPANTTTNSETAKANTNTENSDAKSITAAPVDDNCDGPGDNEVIVYEHIFNENGGGKCVKLKPGEYKNATEIGLANDAISSIKIGVNVRATVCENDNFGAPCEEFDKTDYDLMNNPTIKNDTVSSVKVVEVKAESKPEAVKALANGLAGEWRDGNEILKFTEDNLEGKRANESKPYNTSPYKVIDGKTVEFKFENGSAAKAIMTFEDNGNTLVWYRPDTGQTFKLKRVNPK